MPCDPIVTRDGKVTGIVCSRGRRKAPKCRFCGKPARYECDGSTNVIEHPGMPLPTRKVMQKREVFAPDATCDAPICGACRTNVGPDTDYCPDCAAAHPEGSEEP